MSSWSFNNQDPNWGKWVYQTKGSGDPTEWPSPPKDEQIIGEILEHSSLEDRGFFEDMVAWLRKDAPRKLRGMLQDLFPWTTGLSKASADLSYERLCEVVYRMGFRASEVLERRMVLGPSNKWVKKYFEDFPMEKKQ